MIRWMTRRRSLSVAQPIAAGQYWAYAAKTMMLGFLGPSLHLHLISGCRSEEKVGARSSTSDQTVMFLVLGQDSVCRYTT